MPNDRRVSEEPEWRLTIKEREMKNDSFFFFVVFHYFLGMPKMALEKLALVFSNVNNSIQDLIFLAWINLWSYK